MICIMDDQTSEDGWTLVTYKKKRKSKPKYSLNKIIDDNLSKQYHDDEPNNEQDCDVQFPTPLHYKCKQIFT